jgi:hypothetical protein
MVATETKQFEQCQRIQVARECEGKEKSVKITIERFDSTLGWYTAGALSFPLHQLPLLQQALADAASMTCPLCPEVQCDNKIIPFPTCMPEFVACAKS